ncbi:Vitamin B12 import ATP-binding protein BtuD [Streptomyces sp. RB5]|uniref:Vitamin B12 import ATP-binding protein BtuD n=1 Tax=Streptomyces smaragdinus TaxID=2585196 RepID=A0A7K0CHC8_9ACTN|nr:ABC transporter ATP-binding protein [Streptomyces smaragdinus]MQY12895.1 Vitamin B12 import ATP-binding protein BtuD [Streptomyces smaragdinus]
MTDAIRRAAAALALVRRAGPLSCLAYLALTVVQGLLPAGTALLLKWLLDALQPGADGSPEPLVAGLAGLGVAAAVLPNAGEYLRARLKRGILQVVQDRLFGAVNGFVGMGRFESPAFLDRLRLAQQAAGSAPDQITQSLFGLLQQALALAGLLGVLFVISPVLAALTVVAAVPALLMQLSLSRRRAAVARGMSPRNRRQLFYQQLMLDLRAVKEIRLFGTGDWLLGRMRTETRAINAAEERVDRRVVLTQAPLALLGAVIAGGGLIWMVRGAARGDYSAGDVMAFIAVMTGVQGGLSSVVTDIAGCHQALLLFGHYVDITRLPPDLPRGTARAGALREAVELDDVWFRYPGGDWILRGVSLRIAKGQSLALVGLNGAGKSTLVKLLLRMHDPERGAIRWDGTDLRELDPATLRARVSAVFQDFVSYDLTAAENIGQGDLTLLDDHARLASAAKEADIHDELEALPRGYRTLLSRSFPDEDDPEESEGTGVLLSGGQWQRLALARAMLRSGRDLLILDEPSAGLDAAAEQRVHEQLNAYRDGATSLLISHRLGAVRGADRIVVLAGGRITESGSHAELMAAKGEYARLFTLQAAGYTDAGEVLC